MVYNAINTYASMTPTWILKYTWPKLKEDKSKKWCQEYLG